MSSSSIKIPQIMMPINSELRKNIGKWTTDDYHTILGCVITISKKLKEIEQRK